MFVKYKYEEHIQLESTLEIDENDNGIDHLHVNRKIIK